MMAINGQHVVCTDEPQDDAFRYNIEPFDESDMSQGYLIEVIGEQPKYLSSQYGEVKALISLETVEDMKMYAKETGDLSSQWSITCKKEVEIMI